MPKLEENKALMEISSDEVEPVETILDKGDSESTGEEVSTGTITESKDSEDSPRLRESMAQQGRHAGFGGGV